MATFYTSSTNQRDAMPNLCLRDPGHTPYPEPSITGNMLYLNYPSSSPYSDALTGDAQSQQNSVELPVPTAMISQGSSVEGAHMVSSHLGKNAYNAWRDGRIEMSFMQTIGGPISGSGNLVRNSVSNECQMGLQTQLGTLNGQNLSLQQSNVSTMQNQGLSLSLSTEILVPSFQYRPTSSDISLFGPHQSNLGNGGSCRDDDSGNKNMHANLSPYGVSSHTSSVPNSKYLKAAQELLVEVVNVRKALKHKADNGQSVHSSAGTTGCKDTDGASKSEGMPSNPQESTANSSSELSPSERQDLQNKVTKLLAMLDEVDSRYKQYYHQMQIVVSSFDIIAGFGAAKPYTALALQTISQHFRCLRDAIGGQIRATRKSLGEQDSSISQGGGIARLRYIDQQLRQQRAMQQFGMMQQHSWRPQRGLPESSVSILRAWLFEHFLHPYPKDSEKLMLARQTGLTRSQVSNWFINARVRLWKPMIEDMYKEEFGGTEIDSNSSSENPPKCKDEIRSSEDREDLQNFSAERSQTNQLNDSKSKAIHTMDTGRASASFQHETNSNNAYMNLKLNEQRPTSDDGSLLQDTLTHSDGSGRYMAYQMAEVGRYGNTGFSLTLGLQHCDGSVPISNNQHRFLTVRGEDIYGAAAPIGADTADYEFMNMEDRQHRFGSSNLQHDFVA
nr:BEL1-like homeodomain protein 7 isoform X3 [Elaeis guineensis]XP_029119532.1 BEL1-like homeodomain protein 7 isoform X3 [Elaeis guineensis]XP_029119533.1 BEL1-like homeodomain protein 7 isoform X3 [Elaeis guineensis]XP_029119534.1 BEL1-like homeodomain protein 7 isoform X3 [Elaeis guineensis]XP_029119535.1 BEL1-like homeodomain protein 7 isoform X3 [Elaeis guineensis]XP_029119536.1 BEL1-like homeodomain protein 7 isoform X3 [Elaeis guineensis]XP_029119539.1 BEL1-like homeodomain protein 7 